MQKKVVDKNGKLTTRWVRDYSASTAYGISRKALPVHPTASPSVVQEELPRGAVKEMVEIKKHLIHRMKLEYSEINRSSFLSYDRYTDNLSAVNEAVYNRQYEKVRVYAQYLTVDFPAKHLSQFVDHLQSQGHAGIADNLSHETMDGFKKLSKKMRTVTLGGFPETIKYLTTNERDALMDHASELMYLNPGSAETVYSLIIDLGMTEHNRLSEALTDSDQINKPFLGGFL